MKKLYRRPWLYNRAWKKVAISAVGLFGACISVNAQVNTYTFAQSTGTYSSIAATGTLVTGSDATTSTTNDTTGWTVPIPFTFNFNGVNYTSAYVNSNGGVTFGTTTSNSSTIISTSTTYAGSIGVMSRDLWGVFITTGVTTSGSNIITNVVAMRGIAVGKELNAANGIPTGATVTAFDEAAGTITMSAPATSSSTAAVIRYGTGRVLTSVTGTAPNRVFTIEWMGYNDYSIAVSGSNYLNFQLKLAESTNTVSTVYGPQYNINTTVRTNEIGLRGASNTDFNNRSGSATTAWTATTAGTTNSASVSRDNTIFPASGLTFTWTPPTCIAPSSITASNVTATGASISWTASPTGAANGYEYYYSTTNTAPTSTTVPSGTSATTSATLSSLTSATVYYVWVRSVCSATDKSVWSVSSTFTTLCSPVTALSENFDSYTTGNIVPNCWFRMTGTGSQTITTTTPASGTRNIYQYASTGQTPVIVALPVFSNINAGTSRLKLKARVSSGAPGTLDIGYVTDVNDPATFAVIQSLTINNTVYTSADANYIVNIPSTVPANARLAIRNAVDSKSYYWDDVVYEAIPSCLEVSGVNISAIQTSAATLSWTAPSSAPAGGYEYYYSTSSTAPTTSTVPTGSSTATTVPLTGLAPATTYYVWVRSKCSATDVSAWSASTTFVTACVAVATFTENFDASPVNGLPPCWASIGTTSTYATINASTAISGPNALYLYTYLSGTGVVSTPEISNLQSGNYTLKFKGRANFTAGGVIQIGYLTNPSDVSTFVLLGTYTASSATVVDNYSLDITGVPAGINKLVLRHTGTPSNSVLIDDVSYALNPSLSTAENAVVKNNLRVYPNPFSDVLNISNIKNVKSVSIVDVAGRIVKTFDKPSVSLQLSELNSGMYIVVMNMNDGTKQSVKVIKK